MLSSSKQFIELVTDQNQITNSTSPCPKFELMSYTIINGWLNIRWMYVLSCFFERTSRRR